MSEKRCTECWNFKQYCTCTLDALEAQLPTRCTDCGHNFDFCTCVHWAPPLVIQAAYDVYVYFQPPEGFVVMEEACEHDEYSLGSCGHIICLDCGEHFTVEEFSGE